MNKARLSSYLVPIIILLMTAPVRAAIVYVDKDSPGPTRDGTSWTKAFQTIQAGITAATVSDEVWVSSTAAGYAERLTMKSGVPVYGGFAGTEANRADRNPAVNVTVVDGTGGVTVAFPASALAATMLDGFTLKTGSDNVTLSAGSPVLANCIVTQATRHGISGAAGTATISGCIVSDNAQHGITLTGGAPVVTGNTVAGNGNSGIFCTTTGGAFTTNTVTSNRDHGIRADGSPTSISDNTISANGSGAGAGAGAISCVLEAATAPAIARNVVSNNGGSGVSVTGGQAKIKSNKLTGNDGTQGGGVFASGGTPTIGNNVVASNVSFNEGGGIYLKNATAKVYNNTLSANASGGNGGAVYIEGGAVTFVNNLVVYNSPGLYRASGTMPLKKNNVFGNLLYNYYNITPDATDMAVDPLIAGPVARDLHIQASSPMRNAGDNATVEAGDTDMDGQARIEGAAVDIGADESDGTVYNIPTPTVRVKPITDPVNPGNDANDGSDWTKAKATVQAAVDAAAGGGEVWVATGEYVEQVSLRSGVAMYGGFAGIETLRDQRDPKKWTTVINGGNSPFAVAVPTGAGANEVIDGFTIINLRSGVTGAAAVTMNLAGVVIRNSLIGSAKKGIVTVNSSLELTSTTIRDNDGVGLESAASTVNVTDTLVQSNGGSGFSGVGSLTLVNTSVKSNGNRGIDWSGYLSVGGSTLDGNGNHAAVYTATGSAVAVFLNNVIQNNGNGVSCSSNVIATGNTFRSNTFGLAVSGWVNAQGNTFESNRSYGLSVNAGTGGGAAGAFTVLIRNNTFRANSGDQGYGIGVTLSGSATAGISGNTVRDNFNSRTTSGAGIYVSGGGGEIVNNVVTGNASPNGAGVYLVNYGALVANNLVMANGASNSGGGIYVQSGNPSIINNTLTANTAAGNGGGVYVEAGASTIVNNILAYNTSGLFKAPVANVNLSHNLFWSNPAYDARNISIAGNGNVSADPKLAGAPTRNVHIQPDSPARNAGDNTVIVAGWTDMDNQARTQGATVDIGADESDGTAYSTTPLIVRVNKVSGDDANDGTAWNKAKKTVQGGIEAAAGGGEVWVAKSRYFERLTLRPGVALYGGFAGAETALAQRDVAANETAIDGERLADVITIPPSAGANTIVDGFTIGSTTSGSAFYGIRLLYAAATVRNCLITLNAYGIVSGGGVLAASSNIFEINQYEGINSSANGAVTATSNIFRSLGRHAVYGDSGTLLASANSFTNTGSGGGYCVSWAGPATITNNTAQTVERGFAVTGAATITGNTIRGVQDSYGIAVTGSGAISGNTVENSAGGVWVTASQAVLTGYTVSIDNNTLRANKSSGRSGISCNLSGTATAVIVKNVVQGNSNTGSGSSGLGGGIFAAGGQPDILYNKVFDNSAPSGAGIYLSKTAALVANNFVGTNVASGNGGGVYILQQTTNFGGARLINNTIAANSGGTSGQGGGIYSDAATALITNNIVAFNSGGGIAKVGASDLSLRFNDVFGNLGAGGTVNYIGFTADPTGTFGNISVNPKLGSPIARELHIQPDSPCRNTGENAQVVPAWTDIDGQLRIQDTTVDMGADESDGSPITVLPVVMRVNNLTGDDNNDGLSWAKAKRSIQGAIDAMPGGGEVWVARGNGTYPERVTLRSGIELYGGFAGTETQRNQRNLLANPVAIDGEKGGHVITVPSSAGATQVVDGFTIGNTTTGSTYYGISVANTAVIVANCRITLNAYGIVTSGSLLTVKDSTLDNNQYEGVNCAASTSLTLTNVTTRANGRHNVYGDSGELVMTGGSSSNAGQWGLYWTGTTTVTGAAFSNNQNGIGATGPVVFTSNTVRGTKARYSLEANTSVNVVTPGWQNLIADNLFEDSVAGGVYALADQPVLTGYTVIIRNNTVRNNQSPDRPGIACEANNSASALIQSNTVSRHLNGRTDVSGTGGGMWLKGAGVEVLNNTLTRNGSANGAGIWCEESQAVIANNVITSNGALYSGGGVYINGGTPKLINNTVTGNSAAGDGGAVYVKASKATIANNILSFNTSGVWTNDSGFTFKNNNVFGNLVYDAAGFVLAGNGNVLADPLLAGAPTRNVHIQPASPLRNAGDSAQIPSVVPAWTDVDGQARIQGAAVDIGADESDGTSYSTTPVVIRVNNQTGNDANDGSAWNKAKQTIQAGIEAAAGGGEVWVARGLGVYGEQVVLANGVALYGGFAGAEANRNDRNPAANPTVIDSNLSGDVVTIPTGTGATVTIDGFTIRNSGTNPSPSYAGIEVRYATVVLANTIIQNNQYGIDAAGARISMTDVTLQNNTANGAWLQPNCVVTGNNVNVATNGRYGLEGTGSLTLTSAEVRNSNSYGIVWNGTLNLANAMVRDNPNWGVTVDGTVSITDSTFRNNGAINNSGGLDLSGFATVANSTFQNNRGFGLRLSASLPVLVGYTVNVLNSTISGNTGNDRSGLNVTLTGSASALVQGNIIRNNNNTRVDNAGIAGGVYLNGGAPVVLNNIVTANSAGRGGGIMAVTTDALIANNLVFKNSIASNAVGIGSGLLLSGGNPTLTNNTITANIAALASNGGGAAFDGATAVLVNNNIVANNNGGVYKSSGGALTLRNNNTFGNGIYQYRGLPDPLGTNVKVDPLFVDAVADNYHLQGASPVKDLGDDSALVFGWMDIDGQARKAGAHVDIGADEVVAIPATTLQWSTQPGGAQANRVFGTQPVIRAVNGSGVTDATFNGPVVVNIKAGTGAAGSNLGGSAIVWAVNGVATFTNLSIDKAGIGYRLTAVGGPLGPVDSALFDVSPLATQLVFQVQPPNGTQNNPLSPAPVVAAKDIDGNTATGFTGPVTLSLKPGTGTVGALATGQVTVNAVAGVATFPNIRIDLAGDGYRLVATSGTLGAGESAAFNIAPSGISVQDIRDALSIGGGVKTGTPADMTKLNKHDTAGNRINLLDAARLNRARNGLDTIP